MSDGRASLTLASRTASIDVTPAKAGVQVAHFRVPLAWIPAFAGMTMIVLKNDDSA
jgi:hypothetical protein